jgi:hypothetical protein
MPMSFEDLYMEKLQDEVEFHTVSLAEGAINNFEEYKYKTGLIQGLGLAGSIFNELADRMKEGEIE